MFMHRQRRRGRPLLPHRARYVKQDMGASRSACKIDKLVGLRPSTERSPGAGLRATSGYIDQDVTLSEDEGHGERAPSRR